MHFSVSFFMFPKPEKNAYDYFSLLNYHMYYFKKIINKQNFWEEKFLNSRRKGFMSVNLTLLKSLHSPKWRVRDDKHVLFLYCPSGNFRSSISIKGSSNLPFVSIWGIPRQIVEVERFTFFSIQICYNRRPQKMISI